MAWDDTPEGDDLVSAYNAIVDAYTNKLPDNKQTLDNLSNRPISG